MRDRTSDIPAPAAVVLAACFFLSGAAGLVYEVVWTRMLILVFGSTSFAISTVLTAFMGGLALGAFIAARAGPKIRRPELAYAALEVGIGAFALFVPLLLSLLVPVYRWAWNSYQPSFYAFSLIRFALTGSVLLAPTVMMGATLPLMAQKFAPDGAGRGSRIGLLYALNTAGAVAGAAAAGFVLLPLIGQWATTVSAAAVNFLVAIAALVSFFAFGRASVRAGGSSGAEEPRTAGQAREQDDRLIEQPPCAAASEDAPAPGSAVAAQAKPPDGGRIGGRTAPVPGAALILALIALSGFVSMTHQVAWNRVLHLFIGSSVYAFTVILTTFLAGIAAGAAAAAWALRNAGPGKALAAFGLVQALIAAGVFVTLLYFGEIPYLYAALVHSPLFRRGATISHGSITTIQYVVSGLVMFGPAALIGATFPLALHVRASATKAGAALAGGVYGVNTVGCIFGSFAGGFLLIPALGIRNTILAGIAVNSAAGAAALIASARAAAGRSAMLRVFGAAASLAVAAVAILGAPEWNRLLMARGLYKYSLDPALKTGDRKALERRFFGDREVIFYKEGVTTTVVVVKEDEENWYLATDGKVDASSRRDMPTQVLLAQIPMCVAPGARDVMVIGFASGTTVGSALLHPLSTLTAVEIEPAVIEASRKFDSVNNRPLDDPRLLLVNEDARNFLLATRRKFDLIISEPSNPWMTIASNLFTRDFYEIAASRLEDEGCFCQWLQLYALRAEDAKSIAVTFSSVFPHTYAFFSQESVDLMLVGSRKPFDLDARAIQARIENLAVLDDLDRIGVDGAYSLLARFMAGPDEISAFCAGARLNTDDNAFIEFSAPRALALNIGRNIQEELLEHTRGIAPYLIGHGLTKEERAEFLLQIAMAAPANDVFRLTQAFARNAYMEAPDNPSTAGMARDLMANE